MSLHLLAHGPAFEDEKGEHFVTHGVEARCPLLGDGETDLQRCRCMFHAQAADTELRELGLDDLADDMFQDMTSHGAFYLAQELRAAVAQLELQRGRRIGPRRAATGEQQPPSESAERMPDDDFARAVTAIRETADWFFAAARHGFGVHAWY